MPTMTVCHLTIFLFLDVAHSTVMKTTRPKRLTARFARVLSWLSGLAKDPTKNTATTSKAPAGILSLSGMSWAKRTPVLFHTRCIGFVTIVMGTWKNKIRRVMARYRRKGTSHPRSYRCRTKPAIHQLHAPNQYVVDLCQELSEETLDHGTASFVITATQNRRSWNHKMYTRPDRAPHLRSGPRKA